MAFLQFRRAGSAAPSEVSDLAPLPVEIGPSAAPVRAVGRLVPVGPIEIPGIAAADALDANDAMGTVFVLDVPKAGCIVKARLHDLDDEGIGKELWLFNVDPGSGVAASDAAFALTDAANMLVEDVLTFSFRDSANNQVGLSADVPKWYTAPQGRLWCQFKTLGADNIAAGSMPKLSLLIERYADD